MIARRDRRPYIYSIIICRPYNEPSKELLEYLCKLQTKTLLFVSPVFDIEKHYDSNLLKDSRNLQICVLKPEDQEYIMEKYNDLIYLATGTNFSRKEHIEYTKQKHHQAFKRDYWDKTKDAPFFYMLNGGKIGGYSGHTFKRDYWDKTKDAPFFYIINGREIGGYSGQRVGRDDYFVKRILEYLLDKFNSDKFNKEQLAVEQADTKHKVLIVKASAGTGKTTVMINRIIYLLFEYNLELKDICMLTFTNEAAKQMRERLQSAILKRYGESPSLIDMLEALPSMNISTIDSFFNDLLKQNGFQLGYSQGSKIRGYAMERKEIVLESINEIVKEEYAEQNLPIELLYLEKLVLNLWNEMDAKGFFYPVEHLRFTDDTEEYDSKVRMINHFLPKVLKRAQEKYKELTVRNNALGLSDIKGELIKMKDKLSEKAPWKFIFVDEFQDTDDSQIQTLVEIAKSSKCRQLFVVGDEKQSIYRFRGATDAAFTELERLVDDPLEFKLNRNYRTAVPVQEKLNQIFSRPAERGLLGSDKDINTVSMKKGNGLVEVIPCACNADNYDNVRPLLLDKLRRVVKADKNQSICILTRTNRQVQQVMDWCREEHIICYAKTTGTFYTSRPVMDLYFVLGALLYPENQVWSFDAEKTAYADSGCEQYKERIGYEPVFNLLKAMADKAKPWEKIKHHYWREHYKLNLEKLFKILYERFAGDYASLSVIFSFLQNKILSKASDEDELYPETPQNSIEVMTVHKAKGLEWDVVLLPFTKDPPFKKPAEIYKDIYRYTFKKDGEDLIVGWMYKEKDTQDTSGTVWQNSNYKNGYSAERLEQVKEHTRLLYVALTRCIKKLYCFTSLIDDDDPSCRTWSHWIDIR